MKCVKNERFNGTFKTNKNMRQLTWQRIFKCDRQSEPNPGETMLGL